MPPDQQITEPTADEFEWVHTNVEAAAELAVELEIKSRDDRLTAAHLDALYRWIVATWEDQEGTPDVLNGLINLVGLAFGQLLVDELGLRWVVVSDEQGTEIAVHGQPGDFLMFPPNLVAKRWGHDELDFFQPILRESARTFAALREL